MVVGRRPEYCLLFIELPTGEKGKILSNLKKRME
jgi:hypothetical protein